MPIKDSMFGGAEEGAKDETTPATEPAKKPKRRTKDQLIADARVPGDEEIVEVKFTATKTTGERPWLVAVELFREGKVEFIDPSDAPSPLKYAVMKMDQQKGAGGEGGTSTRNDDAAEKVAALKAQWDDVQKRLDDATDADEIRTLSEESLKVREEILAIGGQDPESDEAYGANAPDLMGKRGDEWVPENAMTGDEIIHGTKADQTEATYYVGHGRVLVRESPTHEGKLMEPEARWFKHEGEWRSVPLVDTETEPPKEALPDKESPAAEGETPAPSSSGPELVQSEAEPVAVGGFNTALWKVSMGYLEKIGLPDYSSLQVGPSSAQAYVLDDGRRTKVEMHGREVTIPTAVVEQMQMCAQVSEYVMRAERQAMINFLEAVKPGSTAPQSS